MGKGSTRISRILIAISLVLFTAVWLSGANRLATRVRAQAQACSPGQTTLTPHSGNGVIGGLDSQVQTSTDDGATWHPAFVLAPNTDFGFPYDTIPGTQWNAILANFEGPTNATYSVRIFFTLPAGFSNPSLAGAVFSDNVAVAFLNGNFLGGQGDFQDPANFMGTPFMYSTSNAAFFVAGSNELLYRVHNFDIITGLDFKNDVCFTPPPAGCVDQAPPSVNCSVEDTQLWPPNHDLENVGLKATITDDCDCFPNGHHDGDDDDDHHGDDDDDDHGGHHGSSASSGGQGEHHDGDDDDDDDGGHHCTPNPGGSHSVQVLVYSDEPDLDIPGSGNFSPDAKNIDLRTLRLRSERSGTADGRVYLIVVKATDASGKIGYCCKTVTVPHDQSNASKNSVNAQALVAKAFFMTNHAPPANFVQVGTGPVVGPKQ